MSMKLLETACLQAAEGEPTRPPYQPAARAPLSLASAEKLAAKILSELAPFCERIEIAGSIRRRRPFVNDIDLVALPLADQVEALRARVLARTTPISDGTEIILTRLANGVQLDLWLAQRPHKDLFNTHDTNFGAIYLRRTGSKAESDRQQRAQHLALRYGHKTRPALQPAIRGLRGSPLCGQRN